MNKALVLRNVGDINVVAGIAMKIYYNAGGWLETSDFLDKLVKEYKALGKSTDNTSGGQGIAKMKPALYFGLIDYQYNGKKNFHKLTDSGKKFYEAYVNANEDEMVDIILNNIPGKSFGQYNLATPESDSFIDPPKVFLVSSLILNGINKDEYAYILQELANDRGINSIYSDIALSRKGASSLSLTDYSKNNYKDDKGLLFLCQTGLTDDKTPNTPIKAKYLSKYSDLLKRLQVIHYDLTKLTTPASRESAFAQYLHEKLNVNQATIEHYLRDLSKDVVSDAVLAITNTFHSIYEIADFNQAGKVKDAVLADNRNRTTYAGFPGTACGHYETFLKEISSLICSCSFLKRSRTSSISWVSSAILLNPMVADMPFRVWALRKISFNTDKSSILSSRLRRPSFNDCKCSCDSSKNISIY